MNQSDYLELMGRYLSGDISEAERDELLRWVDADSDNQAALEEAEKLWSVTENYEMPDFAIGKPAAWDLLEGRIGNAQEGSAKIVKLGSFRNYLRYAAAVAALLGGFWLYWGGGLGADASAYAEIQTGPKKERTVNLPDGSVVVLNENSTLRYPEAFKSRVVELSGEAFFDVVKQDGATFAIRSEGAQTTVLGTSFNVRAYPDEPEVTVTVETGKVEVAALNQAEEKVLLLPGASGQYDKALEEVKEAPVSNALAWKKDLLIFDNQPLGQVAEAIERYFGQEIVLENEQLRNCRFMGEFPSPDLKALLDAMAFTMELEIVEENEQIVIKGDAAYCQ
ncbi:MAG: FecR domain-containing protein [Mameliella sp.]|nr:FecR domain-containing protein [Phaeodactylibacter sp.]